MGTKDYVAAESEVNDGGHHGVFADATETNKLLSNMWRNVIKTDLSTNWGTGAAFATRTVACATASLVTATTTVTSRTLLPSNRSVMKRWASKVWKGGKRS